MKTFIILFSLLPTILLAGDIKGSFSTGIFMGTPFWNSDNAKNISVISNDEAFLRSVNQLRLYGNFADKFSFRVNALRSDGFVEVSDSAGYNTGERLNQTKIYEAFLRYDFSVGNIQLGRIMPFGRWFRGSVDGGAFAIKLGQRIRISALGGLYVPYGLVYDSDNQKTLAYADMAVSWNKASLKAKYYYDGNITKAGMDFFFTLFKIRVNGNYGYDFTNSRLDDGSLNLFCKAADRVNISLNYYLFRPQGWNFPKVDFSYLIERFMLGIQYKISTTSTINFNQIVAMTSERKDYVTYLTYQYRFLNIGFNYLFGESDIKRLSLTLGGHYAPSKNFMVSGGIAPVNYTFYDQTDSQTAIAYYLRLRYRFLKSFMAVANLNYYQNTDILNNSVRGGVRLVYNFGS
ncbi:MAG TPA: hypothetical protein ENK44_05935 [Caldithrix abyssi]|uniref:Uncharacterized protein n=1 Tax=Caldithrix abyssi TaxID=187145 RepID=A0A7V4WVC8_CALAY|nr:hypothetical protein [Caldithrix abyssi]